MVDIECRILGISSEDLLDGIQTLLTDQLKSSELAHNCCFGIRRA